MRVLYDKYGRELAFKRRLGGEWKVMLFGLYLSFQRPFKWFVERDMSTHTYSMSLGYAPNWLASQEKKEKCLKCSRFVKSACMTPVNPDGFYTDGPWDFCCDEFFNPWRYNR